MLQLEDSSNEKVHFSWNQLQHVITNRYQDADILLDTGSTILKVWLVDNKIKWLK